ncbi:hypothetical protein [Paeniglutamicibacter sp. Y32M11]|uniref:hypothetical protein n=1 Tax=Paeniglutamicibacter sp. Y32M11 TaxID=2853258 RepID=UPI001C5320C7|nr:hypothetical protein [Paeniglutamicibacter sp. Y32M11]QXQ11278.1 hypothetical protein KUF55_05060 [Paeniglutamicibacter sp. Y32M11]
MDTALRHHRAPCSCRFNTTALAAASSGFRVVATDERANSTTSAFVATRPVKNTVFSVSLDDLGAYLRGNTTGAPGKIDVGDTLSFTYSQQVNLAPVTPGWAGADLPVTLRLRDGNVQCPGTGNGADMVDIQRAGSTVNLGSVNTKGNFAKTKKTVIFTSTMTSAMIWTPLSSVTSTTGVASSVAPVIESGTPDRNF